MSLNVRAVRKVGYRRYVGFYGKLMEHGEVFEIKKPEHFSANWMEPADEESRSAIERYMESKKGGAKPTASACALPSSSEGEKPLPKKETRS